jgi:hypothetical protein
MSIEKAKKFAAHASLRADPSFALELVGKTLYEIVGVLEEMSAKIDKLTEARSSSPSPS